MWIERKPSLKESTPIENIEPMGTFSIRITQSNNNTTLQMQVEKLSRSIVQYQPVS